MKKSNLFKPTHLSISKFSIPIERYFDSFFNDIDYCFTKLKYETPLTYRSGIKINSDDKNIYAELDLPGFEKNEIEITVENRVLTISAKKEKDGNRSSVICSEFLTFGVDIEKATSTYINGVLKITLPKIEKQATNKIRIE